MEEGFNCFDTAKTSVFGHRMRRAQLNWYLISLSKRKRYGRVLSFFDTNLSPPLVCKLFLKHFSSLIH